MTVDLLISVSEKTKHALEKRAAINGLDVKTYIEGIIEAQSSNELTGFAFNTPEKRAKAWEEWANSHSINTPVIRDDRREVLYEDDTDR